MEEFNEEEAKAELQNDQKNLDVVIDHLIDSVSHFRSNESLADIEMEEWAKMLEVLDLTKYIVSGIMYSYGIPPCGHDHDEDEENDE